MARSRIRRTMGLSSKLFLAMMAMNLLTTLVFTSYSYISQKRSIMQGIDHALLAGAETVKLVGDTFHDRLDQASSLPAEAYRSLLDTLSVLARNTKLQYLYTVVEKDRALVFTLSSYTEAEQERGELNHLFDPHEDASEGLKATIADRKVHYDQYTDEWGEFRSVFIPARSPAGVEYVIGADISLAEIHAVLRGTLFDCLLLALPVFVSGAILSLVLIRSLQGAVGHLARDVDQIAGGDLSTRVDYVANDDLGRLAADINRMTENLCAILSEVRGATDQLTASAGQLSATSRSIAEASDQVAGQVDMAATAGEEMSATSAEIARNCATAAEEARNARLSTATGRDIVGASVAAMGRIGERVEHTAASIAALGVRSEQIGQIVGTIDTIARQTNLLALNAAIEAARAGEQGRGFAVVADEVRALASRTAAATRDIAGMLQSIQHEIQEAVRSMDEGVREVALGSSEATRSNAALAAITHQIDIVSQQVEQIATAAEQQTATTTEISHNVQRITEMVQITAHGSQQSSTAAQELFALSTTLQSLVSRFELAS